MDEVAKILEEERFLEHHHIESEQAKTHESPKHSRSPRNSISLHDTDKLNMVRGRLTHIVSFLYYWGGIHKRDQVKVNPKISST